MAEFHADPDVIDDIWKRLSTGANLALLLALTSPALADPVRCTTSHQRTLYRWHTVCSDGTRALSAYNRTLNRRDTTITASPRQACTGRLDTRTPRPEVRRRRATK